jgi:6-phosphogluconolactonase
MTSTENLHWQLEETAEAVAQTVAGLILQSAAAAIDDHQCFRLVLAGGTTPKRTYEILANSDCDWTGWHFYYGDERCLPVDHKERNSVMVQRCWLNGIHLDSGRHFPMAAELGPEAGAEHYRKIIADIDTFDLVLLGMGEDGHTASLFPNQPWQPQARVIAVNNAPKPPPQRISLGAATIQGAQRRCFIVTGQAKAKAVTQWRRGVDLPIARLALNGDQIIIDRAAWGLEAPESKDRSSATTR